MYAYIRQTLSQNIKNMKVYNLVGLMSSCTYLCDLFHSQKHLAVNRKKAIFMYDVIFTTLFYSFVHRTTNIITIVRHYYFISCIPSWDPQQYPGDDKSFRKKCFHLYAPTASTVFFSFIYLCKDLGTESNVEIVNYEFSNLLPNYSQQRLNVGMVSLIKVLFARTNHDIFCNFYGI